MTKHKIKKVKKRQVNKSWIPYEVNETVKTIGWKCRNCGEFRENRTDFNDFDCEEPNFEIVG